MKMRAVFMLSTGRTGTGTFAHLLQQSRYYRAFHVPKPELLQEAFNAQQALDLPHKIIESKISAINDLMNGYQGKIYAETNNKIYPFARELGKRFDARFFWVIRDPFEYVNSGLSRKWYTGAGGIWDEYRERPRTGWMQGMSQEQMIAWQWCEINTIIETAFGDLKDARVYHFSDLRADVNLTLNLLEWLGATDLTRNDVTRVFRLRINVGRYSAPRDPETGDHIFGEKNDHETEKNSLDCVRIRKIIEKYWLSPHSMRYLI